MDEPTTTPANERERAIRYGYAVLILLDAKAQASHFWNRAQGINGVNGVRQLLREYLTATPAEELGIATEAAPKERAVAAGE